MPLELPFAHYASALSWEAGAWAADYPLLR